MHDFHHGYETTVERFNALDARLRRCEQLGVCAPLEILKLPTGDIIHYAGVPQAPHVSQFSKKSNQTVTAPAGGTTRERIKFDTQTESEGGVNVNSRVTLITAAGSDQGIMEPQPGHYLFSASGLLSVSRESIGIINGASGTPIVVTTTSAHPFAVGDHLYIYNIAGNVAANGFHIVTATTSTSFTLGNSATSGTYSVVSPADTAVQIPWVVGSGQIELRRKPSGGSWSDYRSSRVRFDFPKIHEDSTVIHPFAIPAFEVTADAGDQFELSIVVQAGEDVTVAASGDFDPAGNVHVTWDYRGP